MCVCVCVINFWERGRDGDLLELESVNPALLTAGLSSALLDPVLFTALITTDAPPLTVFSAPCHLCLLLRFTTVLLHYQSSVCSPELKLWCRNNLWRTNEVCLQPGGSSSSERSLKSSLICSLIESIKTAVQLKAVITLS